MNDLGIVKGSKEAAQPIVVGKDTVYIHLNIRPCKDENTQVIYEYRELQFTLAGYIQMLSSSNPSEILETLTRQYGEVSNG